MEANPANGRGSESEQVNAWLELRPSGIHGRGGFAARPIPAGTRVIDYIGDRISKTEAARRCEAGNPFIFVIDDAWDLDGAVEVNAARFLNHSCDANCEAEQHGHEIYIVTCRDIAQGEELTFDYGYDLSEWRDYPCGCGAVDCLGFIVAREHREQVRRELVGRSAEPSA